MDQGQQFDMWGIAEVMGHRRFAGRITEQTIAGAALVRVDIPEVVLDVDRDCMEKTVATYSKLFGVGSIYCITPTTEDVARRAAAELAKWENTNPIPVALPVERQIPASAGAPHGTGGDDFEVVADDADDYPPM